MVLGGAEAGQVDCVDLTQLPCPELRQYGRRAATAHSRGGTAGAATYDRAVLSALRGPDGSPSPRVRLMAMIVVAGMVLVTAPLLVAQVIRALF
jgi:hypothetical protein